ncbi:cytosolic protein [Bacillus sp. EAC]|uniref:cytosolic protein n=1 Tax=Bacillus sp. EAC TaxID=1978338 RepID=UPI000B436E9C|nr:cytosolic protein [Bacillus sp. EAC]
MKSFNVTFHKEDNVDNMLIQKLNDEEYHKATEGGTRHLFEIDTNIGFFVFFDSEDNDGNVSHLLLQYEDEEEDPIACYSFAMKDYYEFMALYLNDLEFIDETEGEEEVELEATNSIHHLVHLLFHIIEEGNDLEV